MQLKENFVKQYNNYVHNIDIVNNIIHTEDEVKCSVNSLQKEKIAGQDNIAAEYLQFVGGRLINLLTKLFNVCLVHGYVPDAIGSSVIVPVSKGDGSKDDVLKRYRPVALNSVMAKVFITYLMLYLYHYIITDSLQFCFVLNKNCQKVLLMLSSIVAYFNQRQSDIFLAGLDSSMAFDSVNHYGL